MLEVGPVTEQVVQGNDPHRGRGRVCERDITRVRLGHGTAGQNYCVINLIFMDPCIVDDSVEIPTRCRFVIEFIIPKFIEVSTCFELHTAHHQEL